MKTTFKQKTNSDLLAAAVEARTAHEYQTAVSLYTEALESKDLTPETEYFLLDGRAACYEQLGDLPLQIADLKAANRLLARQLETAGQAVDEREAELAVINSVQTGLATRMELQEIYDLVGDEISDIFRSADVVIMIFDPQSGLSSYPYMKESGVRLSVDPIPLGDKGFTPHVMHTRQPLLINDHVWQAAEKYRSYLIAGEASKSMLIVPLLLGKEARGAISLQDMEHEYAYSESDVRLLTMIANSLSNCSTSSRGINLWR